MQANRWFLRQSSESVLDGGQACEVAEVQFNSTGLQVLCRQAFKAGQPSCLPQAQVKVSGCRLEGGGFRLAASASYRRTGALRLAPCRTCQCI